MIVLRVKAGMGNQLFEYALGRRLAHRHRTVLKLDLEEFEPGYDIGPDCLNGYRRKVMLDAFRIQAEAASPAEADRFRDHFHYCRTHPMARAVRLVRRVRPRFCFPSTHVRERGYAFDPAVLETPDNRYLEGFWQSEKYFADAADVVRADLEFRDPELKRYAREYVRRLRRNGRQAVSVHARRGDLAYATEVLKKRELVYGDPVGVDYLQAAMGQFQGNFAFLVFSDSARDIAWCRANLRGEHLSFSEGHTDLQDFALMRECDHHIIANSTFSWWPAWLNDKPGRRVIAPQRWFNPTVAKTANTNDLLPASWQKL